MVGSVVMRLTAVAAVTLAGLVAWAALLSAAQDDLPEIERLLRARAAEVLAVKDPSGRSTQRASYSRALRRVDDDTRETGFLVDTATEDTMVTRRYRLTLRRGPSDGAWRVEETKLEDTWEALTREVPGTEEFGRFDAFLFQKEGLAVRSGPGFLYMIRRGGSVQRIVLSAPDPFMANEKSSDSPGKYVRVALTV